MTTFFKQLSEIIAKCKKVSLAIQPKAGKLTVSFFPDNGDKDITDVLKPLVMNGTPEELDEGFFERVTALMGKVGEGLQDNLDTATSELDDTSSSKKKKEDRKKGAAAGRAAKAAKKPAGKQDKAKASKGKPAADKDTDAPAVEEKKDDTPKTQQGSLL